MWCAAPRPPLLQASRVTPSRHQTRNRPRMRIAAHVPYVALLLLRSGHTATLRRRAAGQLQYRQGDRVARLARLSWSRDVRDSFSNDAVFVRLRFRSDAELQRLGRGADRPDRRVRIRWEGGGPRGYESRTPRRGARVSASTRSRVPRGAGAAFDRYRTARTLEERHSAADGLHQARHRWLSVLLLRHFGGAPG